MDSARERTETIERSEIAYLTDRMEAIRERPGNPEGVQIARFGGATCTYSRTMPWGAFNRVKGLREGDERLLAEIVGFYRERDRKPHFELVPGLAEGRILTELDRQGFVHSGFHASMYAETRALPEPLARQDGADGIVVRPIGEDEFRDYARIHCRGFGMSDDGIPHVEANNVVLFGRPGWRFYLALLEGRPAGTAVSYMDGDVASLTLAATLPEFRGRGVHAALLRRRMDDAAVAGCRLVVGQCAYLSPSYRNMEKAGLRIGYVRATWTER